MIFDIEHGYFKPTEGDSVNKFCNELADEAMMKDHRIIGRYGEVYLIVENGMTASDIVDSYHTELEKIHDYNLKKNGEGYVDMTAYKAIKSADGPTYHRVSPEDKERHSKLIGCLHRICELSDFTIEERIVVKDKRTGKIWR